MNKLRIHSAVQGGVALPGWGNQTSDRLSYDGVGSMITKRYLTGGRSIKKIWTLMKQGNTLYQESIYFKPD